MRFMIALPIPVFRGFSIDCILTLVRKSDTTFYALITYYVDSVIYCTLIVLKWSLNAK